MRVGVVLAVLAAAAVFAGSAQAAPGFVALGDSYAAGPLIPLPLPPWGCLKSSSNTGHLAQLQLAYAEYRDATCSGAETADMTAPQGVSPEPNPPQFNSLTADTALVTVTIGGNDIGFSSIAKDCVSTTPSPGSPCHDKYVVNGSDEISRRIADTAPKVAAVLQGIHTRSPAARVLVVNYSAIFPHTGPGCYPTMPVADGDVPWMRAKQEELNGMMAQQAALNDARVVDVYAASVGHDACALPGLRWVEPVVPANSAAPLHPNLLGMKAMADLVVAAARG
jgi:lysophospholipase L1-like esterase